MASSDIYTSATQGAVLALGRAPVWSTQPTASGAGESPPSVASDGVAMQGAVRALVHVSLRAEPHRRTALLGITNWDGSDVYNVRVNGITVAHDASGGDVDVEDTVDGLVALLAGDSDIAALVTATAVESDPGVSGIDSILIEGIVEEDWSIVFETGTSADLTIVTDLAYARATLWWLPGARPGSSPPALWASSGDQVDIERRGNIERYDVAGMSRLYVQLDQRCGMAGDGEEHGGFTSATLTYRDPAISIGPCLAEL